MTTDAAIQLHSGDYVARYNAKPLDRVAALVPRMRLRGDEAIADFACGNGMLLHALGAHRGRYEGVDFSDDFIASANQWATSAGKTGYAFHCADIAEFCQRHPGAFDIAATLDFSEHIDDATFVRLYTGIRSALRTGGRLFLHTPNLDFFLERLKDRGIVPQFPEHIAVRTADRLSALLVQSGFDAAGIGVETIAHYNVLKHLHPLRHLPLAGRLFAARLWIEARA
jgi:SAM-dependent methyltransferase